MCQDIVDGAEPTLADVVRGDIDEVVEIHMASFPGFFLTRLGARFIQQMYLGFLADPSALFLASRRGSLLTGFAVGAPAGAGGTLGLFRRRLPTLFLAALPAAMRHPISIGARLSAKLAGADGTPALPSDGVYLRSIAVHPRWQGRPDARLLLSAFETAAARRGAKRCVLTTDAHDNDRANRFYVRAGYQPTREYLQHGSRRMLYYEKPLAPPECATRAELGT